MKIAKIYHREQDRIMLQFPYEKEKISLVKQIEGITWSQTRRAWHIPFTMEAYQSLTKLFPEVDGSISEFSKPKIIMEREKPPHLPVIENNATVEVAKPDSIKLKDEPYPVTAIAKDVNIEVAERKIFVSLPKNDDDTRFILSLRYSRWDSKNRQWIVPDYRDNLDLIRERFGLRVN